MQILVIGATGYIGSHIYFEMKKRRVNVLGTSYKREKNFIQFDLGKDKPVELTEQITEPDKFAIICSAVSNIDRCRNEYQMSYHINVTATKALIQQLYMTGFQIIYFSSDNVFDGKKGNYSENDAVNPLNAYGCMKVEIEDYLREQNPESCIFRLTKVVDSRRNDKNMFTGWETQCGKTAYCFKDNFLTCVAMEDVVNAVTLAIQYKLKGIYHLSSDETIKRDILMRRFYEILGIKDCDIKEKYIEDFGLLEKRPLNTSLCNHKFKHAADYQFYSMEEIMNRYAINKKVGVEKGWSVQEKLQ